MDRGSVWLVVVLLALVATALSWILLRRHTPTVVRTRLKAQGDHLFTGTRMAGSRDSIMPRPPLMQSEYEQSEDDMQQERLGPRGVPGEKFPFGMTPERRKKTPVGNDPGHTA